jgi:flotillin
MEVFFSVIFMLVAAAGVALVAYLLIRTRYKKAGPDEALIVYGRRKFFGRAMKDERGGQLGLRIIRGGGSFVWPAWEQYKYLSLKMMTLEVDLKHVYTVQGIPINVRAVAQVKAASDMDSVRRSAEGFLGTGPEAIQATLKETVAGHLRGIIGTLTVEELYRDQRRFQDSVRKEAHVDLEGMGFEFKSFVFQSIWDDQGYLNALGQPRIQDALMRARVATAEADRDASIQEHLARQQKEQRRLGVDVEIAEAQKGLNLRQATIKQEVDVANAQAVKAGEMEIKTQDIRIAEREVERQKLQLNATIREQADARKYESERLADAEQYRVEREATADRRRREEAAAALEAEGLARAKAESAQHREIGLAEAEAIQARGEAEAAARRLLAEALRLYNEAGLSIEALRVLPEVASAVAQPLSRTGATTIISQGGGNGVGTGASKLTEDVASVLGQLGPLMRQLAGVDLSRLLQDLSRLPGAMATRMSSEGGQPQPPAAH